MRRMSSANLSLEGFVLGSCSSSLTLELYLFHFHASRFMEGCRRELNKSVLSGSLCSGLRSRWQCECERTLLELNVWFFDDVVFS